MPFIGKQLSLITLVYDAIDLAKTNGDYVYNDFDLDWTFLPITELEGLPQGKLWIVGKAFDDKPNLTRCQTVTQRILPIDLAFQRSLNSNQDKETIAEMINLLEQLYDTVRNVYSSEFQWLETIALKTPEGTPYSYQGLRQLATFEAIFTPHYLTTIT